MEYFTNFKDILFLDGRKYANQIRSKSKEERKWWENTYLWFHDNFELIMIIGGCILLALLIFNYLDSPSCSDGNKLIIRNQQHGGDGKIDSKPDTAGNTSSSNNTPSVTPSTVTATNNTPKLPGDTGDTKPTANKGETKTGENKGDNKKNDTKDATKHAGNKPFVTKSEAELRADARAAATDKKVADILAGKAEPEKTTNQKMRSKFLSGRAEKNITKAKEAIKGMPGKAFGAVAGKSVAAWQSVKSGEALEKGKEKFEDALNNAGDFAKQNAKAGYALAFTTFMIVGFGLFFVPTLIMFVIGAVTLVIFNKQKMKFFESI